MKLLHKLLVHRNDKVTVQLFRYGIVALAALVVDFSIYASLVKLTTLHAVWAATIGFAIGIMINYLLSTRWVFNQRHLSSHTEFMGFLVIGIIGLALTDFIIWLLVVEAHGDALIAKLTATVIVFFWNFGARKFVLFNKES